MKRIGIYVYYDEQGVLADYAVYYLTSLLEITKEIIFVINGKLNSGEIDKIADSKIKIIQRENTGYDFWGYREGLLSIGEEKLEEFDELILSNSSVFGPIFPLGEIFKKMNKNTVDFWGLTRHSKTKKIKEHIQTYFMVFKKKMFTSPEFRTYFKNLKKVKNKKEAISLLEVNFTEHFENLGFNWAVLADTEGADNRAQYLTAELVDKFALPLIKKTVFGVRYDVAQRENGGNQTERLFELLKNTNYDISFITKEIARIYPMDEIRNFLNLNFILPEKYREFFSPNKTAILLDNSAMPYSFLEPYLDSYTDVYLTVKTNESPYFLDNKKSVFEQIKSFHKKYDYVLLLFPDKDGGKRYFEHILNCTILNRNYLANVLNTFKKNPHIGVLTPIPYIFPGFEIGKETMDEKEIEGFLSRIEFKAKARPVFLNALTGAVWICREFLASIDDVVDFDYETKMNKGAIFSLIAQKHGFLTATISPPLYAAKYAQNLEYTLLKSEKTVSKIAFKLGNKGVNLETFCNNSRL